jgi:hypothetical protein
VKEQWVLGGVERESRKTNLLPIPDRTADTLMAVLRDWIEPGTTVISDRWSEYRNTETHGYTQNCESHYHFR